MSRDLVEVTQTRVWARANVQDNGDGTWTATVQTVLKVGTATGESREEALGKAADLVSVNSWRTNRNEQSLRHPRSQRF